MSVMRGRALTLVSLLAFLTSLPFAAGQMGEPTSGKVVLRLPYRGDSDKRLTKPYTIGMFELEEEFYVAGLMGTDWDSNIYIADPIEPNLCVLKRFARQGRFQEAWRPIRAKVGDGVAVTKDGYIWTGLRWVVSDRLDGLPIVVYRTSKKEPVMDWRYKLPQAVESKIRNVLKDAGLEWKQWKELRRADLRTNDWHVLGLQCSQEQIAISLSAPFMGTERRHARVLWLLMRSDGSRVLDAQLGTKGIPHLTSDGSFWLRESNFAVEPWTWSKVWYWEKGKERGEPLIDLLNGKDSWLDKLNIPLGKPMSTSPSWKGYVYEPQITVDGKGYIYLIWERNAVNPHESRFQIAGKTITLPPPSLGGEQALIVLDSQRRLVTHLPWMPGALETPEEWIKPLPDGSGFYRIQFLEKEAQVFFHPLPK